MHRAWKIPMASPGSDFHGLHKEIRIIVHVEWREVRGRSPKGGREAGEQPAVVWNFYQWYTTKSMFGIGTVLSPKNMSECEWASQFSRERICRKTKFHVIILCTWYLPFSYQLQQQTTLRNSNQRFLTISFSPFNPIIRNLYFSN